MNVFMLKLRPELDLFEDHGAREKHVHELAVRRAAAHLLDLGVVGPQAVVDPGQHIVPREVVRCYGRAVDVHRHTSAFSLNGRSSLNY